MQVFAPKTTGPPHRAIGSDAKWANVSAGRETIKLLTGISLLGVQIVGVSPAPEFAEPHMVSPSNQRPHGLVLPGASTLKS